MARTAGGSRSLDAAVGCAPVGFHLIVKGRRKVFDGIRRAQAALTRYGARVTLSWKPAPMNPANQYRSTRQAVPRPPVNATDELEAPLGSMQTLFLAVAVSPRRVGRRRSFSAKVG